MFAQLKHVAIQSDIADDLHRFYADLFHMESFRGEGSGALSDGNIGLNFNRRSPGRQAGLDHFGFDVEDVDVVRSRLKKSFPSVELLQRPPTRPYAALGSHDPDGNYFDLSNTKEKDRRGIHSEDAKQLHDRRIHHLALRTMHPAEVVKYYMDVYELQWAREPDDGPTYHLTDGTTHFMITQWSINDFEGGGIARPALDHIGFEVESLDAFKADLEKLIEVHPEAAPKAWTKKDEREARLGLLDNCPHGEFQLWDPNGVLLDVFETR